MEEREDSIFDLKYLKLYHNGFGFQYIPGEGIFVIARNVSDNIDLKKLFQLSGAKTLKLKDFLSCNYLCIDKSEVSLIEEVMFSLSMMKEVTYITNNELAVQSKYIPVFTVQEMENGFIRMHNEMKREGYDIFKIYGVEFNDRKFNEENWVSKEGKEFCKDIKEEYIVSKKVKKERDEEECAVCLSNKPIMVIVPCFHRVLCEECARDLRKRNTKKCIICRSVIEDIVPSLE